MSAAGAVEVITNCRSLVGEGPVWDHTAGQLFWVDIASQCIHSYEPSTGRNKVWRLETPVSAICPAGGGLYVVATGIGLVLLALNRPNLETLVALPGGDRMNDAKTDPRGRVLGGTYLNSREADSSGLYSFDLDAGEAALIGSATVPNGLGWSPDGRLLYFADSPRRAIDVFDYDVDTGEATNRRHFADFSCTPGNPDGLTVDEDGYLWVAVVRGGQVVRLDPRGRLEETVTLPANFVTSCSFGGEDLRDLYITSGCVESHPGTPDWALAGALFRVETTARGVATTLCRLPGPDRNRGGRMIYDNK